MGTVSGTTTVTNIDGKSTMNITQTTNNAVIYWDSFNVGKNSTVNFIQPSVSAMTLNHVTGDQQSVIQGNINSIGSLIFINPNGMLFDSGSVVNAAGIIASTADLANSDSTPFAGDAVFINNGTNALLFSQKGTNDQNIVIRGTINASTNGNYIKQMSTDITALNTAITNYNTAHASDAGFTAVDPALAATPLNLVKIKAATGFSAVNNIIKLVAEGDIAVTETGKLQAVTTTTVTSSGTVGADAFSVEGSSSTRDGSIVMRADQNANELAAVDTDGTKGLSAADSAGNSAVYDPAAVTRYDRDKTGTDSITAAGGYKVAKVYLKNTDASQVAAPYVSVYYEPDITASGLKGTAVSAIGVTKDTATSFTQKDYTKYGDEAQAYKSKVAQTFAKISNVSGSNTSADGSNAYTTSNAAIQSETYNMLVNDVYQLQAIQDTAAIAQETGDNAAHNEAAGTDTNYYGNLGGSYALGTTIAAADTTNWNDASGTKQGFNPIGSAVNPFTGSFSGNGGSNTYGIYDLYINRTTAGVDGTDIGLFASIDGGSVWSTSVVDSNINGHTNVGGIAGYVNNGIIYSSTVRKRVKASDGETTKTANVNNVTGTEDVGGLAGLLNDSQITWYSYNASQVGGTTNVGGLAGEMTGTAATKNLITDSSNRGYMSDTETYAQGYGVISGSTGVGGLVGKMNVTSTTTSGGTVTNGMISASNSKASSYNNGTVTGDKQVGGLVGELDSGVVQKSYNTNEKSPLSSSSVISGYGRVTGSASDAGGLVGQMTGGLVQTSYNAGNVSGNQNVGGVVGYMTGGTIQNAYNADNNTVLQTAAGSGTANTAANQAYYGFTSTDGYTYSYDSSTQLWNKAKTGVTTTQVATGALPGEDTRTYNNRLAYRDATVTGTTNVGGFAGNISGGTVTDVYTAGRVNGTTNVGGFAGSVSGSPTAADSFYVTTRQDGSTNISGQTAAVGAGTLANVTAKTLYQAQNLSGTTTNGVDWTGGSTNQDATWMIYSNSATPLLKQFMSWININRQYEYDGTTHNLMTSDVPNYYGGAFFTDGKGQNVNSGGTAITDAEYSSTAWVIKTGSASADHSQSELYTYDQSDMWSPQHGYYTDAQAKMIVTPVTLKANLTGTTTYGDVLSGYTNITGLSGDALTAANAEDNYKLTISTAKSSNNTTATNTATGLMGTDTLNTVLGSDWAVSNGTNMTGASGTAAFQEGTGQTLGAGSYSTTTSASVAAWTGTPTITGSNVKNGYTANSNYKLSTSAALTVNKADLYYTAAGQRAYQTENATGSFSGTTSSGTALGFSAVTQGTTETDALNNGALKSWDSTAAKDLTQAAVGAQAHIQTNTTGEATYAASGNYTLIATEAAKTGTSTTSKTIGTDTWVKDSAAAPGAYSLAAGSFQNSNGTSQLVSSNYNLIYVGNTQGGAASGQYTVTPLTTSYAVTTTSEYGTGVRTNETATFSGVTGTAQEKLLDDLAAANQLSKQHVTAKTENGQVLYNPDGTVQTASVKVTSTTAGTLSDNPNYLLTGGTYTYTITPTSVTYKAKDDSWISGAPTPVTPLSGSFGATRNGDVLAEGPAEIRNTTDINGNSAVGEYRNSIISHGLDYTGISGHLYDYKVTYQPGTMIVQNNTTYDNATHVTPPDNKFGQDVGNRINGLDGTGMLPPTEQTPTATTTGPALPAGNEGSATDGGYIPKEARNSIRFLTLEDTVIQLSEIAKSSGDLTIDASSRTDGGASTSVDGTGTAVALAGTMPLIEGTTIGTANTSLILTENGVISGVTTLGNSSSAGPAADSTSLATGDGLMGQNPARGGFEAGPAVAGVSNGAAGNEAQLASAAPELAAGAAVPAADENTDEDKLA